MERSFQLAILGNKRLSHQGIVMHEAIEFSDIPVILVKKREIRLKSFLFCEKISVGRTVPFAVHQNDRFFHSKGKHSLFWPNIYDKLLMIFETFVGIQSRGYSIWQSNALFMGRIFEKRLLFSQHQFNSLKSWNLVNCLLNSVQRQPNAVICISRLRAYWTLIDFLSETTF